MLNIANKKVRIERVYLIKNTNYISRICCMGVKMKRFRKACATVCIASMLDSMVSWNYDDIIYVKDDTEVISDSTEKEVDEQI